MNELQQATARAIVNVFETGRILGDYGAVAVAKGDSGHLSYGRSQAALGSGTLYVLLQSYCDQPGAAFASKLVPYLPRLRQRDITLDLDANLAQLLERAGREDPVMQSTQDRFFDRSYFVPACAAAEAMGVMEPLGQTVIYDSHIQGGWAILKRRVGPPTPGKTQDWVKRYIGARTEWLRSLKPPVPTTVYRMDAFNALIRAQNWELQLPIDVRGVTISEQDLRHRATAAARTSPRLLQLTTPYLRGTDVEALQRALYSKFGITLRADGIYGPFTNELVTQWQKDESIDEIGVGESTRKSLGLVS